MTESARILIVEDEWIVARAVQKTLETAGYHVSDVVTSAREALAAVERCRPDLALVDIVLNGGVDGIELARQLRSQASVPFVYVTAYSDTKTLGRAAETEPAGYVVKPFQEGQLLSAVAMALRTAGGQPGSNGHGEPTPVTDVSGDASHERRRQLRTVAVAVSSQPTSARSPVDLTSRELEVVRLLLSNGRVSSIAKQLGISPHTVRNHLRSIFRKLGVHSQVELIRELTSLGAP